MDYLSPRDVARKGLQLEFDDSGTPRNPLICIPVDSLDLSLAADAAAALPLGTSPVLIGVASSAAPTDGAVLLERMTCTLGRGPGIYCAGSVQDLRHIKETLEEAPYASLALDALLRATAGLPTEQGLLMESSTYSMLLASTEFARWRRTTPRRANAETAPTVLLDRVDEVLAITLNRPLKRNAFSARMRDELLAALDLANEDSSIREVLVRGAGPCFCSGGDLDEFGSAENVAAAHLWRLHHSVGRAFDRTRDRLRVVVHGACIGAGIEVPAFAARVEAQEGASFALPELRMGLIPGAGGTVSVTRRIGRWRTAYMALTARRVDLRTALQWGLVDSRA